MNKVPGRVHTTLETVEDFYGEKLCASLYKTIRQTPFDQLLELADRVAKNSRAVTEWVFRGRQIPGGSDKFPLFVHDTTYLHGGRDMSLMEAPALKHLILHAEHFVLPDRVAEWALNLIFLEESHYYFSDSEQQESANELAEAVRMIELLLPLVRLGSVVLLPPKNELSVKDEYIFPLNAYGDSLLGPDWPDYRFESDLVEAYALDDPYMAWVAVNKLKAVDDWEYVTQGFNATDLQEAAYYLAHQAEYYPELKAKLDKLVEVAYGGRVRPEGVRDAVQINLLCGEMEATPIISTQLARNHLLNSAAVVLEGNHAKFGKKGQALEAAVAYRVPSLAAVSLADLMKLRLNEDIYYEIRKCLESLALGLAAPKIPASFDAYEREVREQAEYIVRPVYEKLSAKLRREKALSMVAGYGIGGLVSLGINGLAMLTHGAAEVAVRSTGNTANNLGKKFGQRALGRNRNDLSTACSILVSLLEDR